MSGRHRFRAPSCVVLAALFAVQGFSQTAALRDGPLPRDQISGGRDRASQPAPTVYEDAVAFGSSRQRLLSLHGRVVGGSPAPVGAYPWTVAIGLADQPMSIGQFCGGSLIANTWVLTAAHCLDRLRSNQGIVVKHGSNFLSTGGQVVPVAEIIIHPNWNRPTFENDIALLRLGTSPIEPHPVRMLPKSASAELFGPGILAFVAGWGLTAENGAPSDVLRHVGVAVVSNETCNGPLSYAGQILGTMVCAGFAAGDKDSCQGDSGGPLMVFDRKGGYFLAGIVSWGDGCAREDKYGVYTRVAEYSSWISQKTGL